MKGLRFSRAKQPVSDGKTVRIPKARCTAQYRRACATWPRADVAADLTFGLGTDIAVSCRDDQATVYRIEPVNATFRCTAVAVGSGTATHDVDITVSSLDLPHAWRLLSV